MIVKNLVTSIMGKEKNIINKFIDALVIPADWIHFRFLRLHRVPWWVRMLICFFPDLIDIISRLTLGVTLEVALGMTGMAAPIRNLLDIPILIIGVFCWGSFGLWQALEGLLTYLPGMAGWFFDIAPTLMIGGYFYRKEVIRGHFNPDDINAQRRRAMMMMPGWGSNWPWKAGFPALRISICAVGMFLIFWGVNQNWGVWKSAESYRDEVWQNEIVFSPTYKMAHAIDRGSVKKDKAWSKTKQVVGEYAGPVLDAAKTAAKGLGEVAGEVRKDVANKLNSTYSTDPGVDKIAHYFGRVLQPSPEEEKKVEVQSQSPPEEDAIEISDEISERKRDVMKKLKCGPAVADLYLSNDVMESARDRRESVRSRGKYYIFPGLILIFIGCLVYNAGNREEVRIPRGGNASGRIDDLDIGL
ncbi:MAG: hypothetical protein ABIE68_03790 [bacterium]